MLETGSIGISRGNLIAIMISWNTKRRDATVFPTVKKRVKGSAWKYICGLVIAMCKKNELEDYTDRVGSKSYRCKSMLPLKLEILLKGITLSVGIFYLVLIEHIKKQITTHAHFWYGASLLGFVCGHTIMDDQNQLNAFTKVITLATEKKNHKKKVTGENVLKLFIYFYSNMAYNSKEDRLIFLKGPFFVQVTRKTWSKKLEFYIPHYS